MHLSNWGETKKNLKQTYLHLSLKNWNSFLKIKHLLTNWKLMNHLPPNWKLCKKRLKYWRELEDVKSAWNIHHPLYSYHVATCAAVLTVRLHNRLIINNFLFAIIIFLFCRGVPFGTQKHTACSKHLRLENGFKSVLFSIIFLYNLH